MEQYDEQLARQVWQRVHSDSGNLDAAAPLALAVAERITKLRTSRTAVCVLSRRMGSNAVLRCIAAQQQVQIQRLEAIYYVLTARRAVPAQPPRPPAGSLAWLLRHQVQQAQQAREAFLELAEAAPDYAGVFTQLAGQSHCHAQQLLQLLTRQLCSG